MKLAAACALLQLLPVSAAAAILESAYLPPSGDGAARQAAPERHKPIPAPAPTHHYAGAPNPNA
jgi:hypothetical protein